MILDSRGDWGCIMPPARIRPRRLRPWLLGLAGVNVREQKERHD